MLPVLWLLEGILVGFGAILPGVSGGALCAAFGMYRPIIETMADLPTGLKNHGRRLSCFCLGGVIGFMGLSGAAAWLLKRNTALITCLFIGFVFGTLPVLWIDAGKNGRGKRSIVATGISFAGMLLFLSAFKRLASFQISAGLSGFFLCGVLWGLSFIVPGLSSSTLLLFFGLYQPMLEGIATFDLKVLLPLGVGLLLCVLLLTRLIQMAYQRYETLISHCILGIVAATGVALLPCFQTLPQPKGADIELAVPYAEAGALVPDIASDITADIAAIGIGAASSFYMTKACDKFNDKKAGDAT